MSEQLIESIKPVKTSSGASAATTAVNSTAVALDGFDGVMHIIDLGTVVDGCVLTATAQQGAASNGSDAVAITGAATASITAATSSNTLMIVDVATPTGAYQRVQLTRTTQNATVQTITSILYRAKNKPTVADATVLAQAAAIGT